MEKEQIKLAFSKVKQDMLILENEVSALRLEVSELNSLIRTLSEELTHQRLQEIAYPTDTNSVLSSITPTDSQTIQQINPTLDSYPTDSQTVPQEIEGLKTHYFDTSTGNRGVPTDRQTVRQTDQQTENKVFLPYSEASNSTSIEANIQEASEILNSLDRLKKEIRLKFKNLTSQEMLVFSTIYQLEENDPQNNTYNHIAFILHLSESSIRDYVQKMIKKGIPIKKNKINNRKILLFISQDLKKIATLPTIIKLREL
ncbi:MAG: hypothetical protein WC979_03465 [Candidatus Pacearchaeota archaeon]|jgi:hypothetical protein